MMHPKRRRRWLALTAALVGVALLGSGAPIVPAVVASVPQDGTTTVAVSPPQAGIGCDATKVVDIRLNDVTDLFGVDIKISYDTSILDVVDADLSTPGTQVQPGDLPDVRGSQGLIQTNEVDKATGTISYVAVRLNPALPQTGSGVVASINFRGKAAGVSAVTLSSVLLSNQLAQPIQADLMSGQISVTCPGPGQTPQPTATTQAQPTAVPSPGPHCTYVVMPGDTLYSIARRHGTTIAALLSANDIADPNLIQAGQTLIIPGCQPGPQPPSGDCFAYTVVPGDTLSGIALANCDTITGLATRNGIVNPNLIFAGQQVTVCPGCAPTPGPGPCQTTHVVAPGENLFRISLAYGVNIYTLAAVNNIANPNLIYAGQVLCIP